MDRVIVNTASIDQLCKVRGIGLKQAKAIVYHREMYGLVTKTAFSMMLMGAVYEETWNQLDFSVPSRIQIKKERADTSFLLLLASLEAEAAELESQISETEFQLSKLSTQSKDRPVKKIKRFQQSLTESHKVPKNTAATQTPPHQPRPTVQKIEPVKDSAYEDQFFKLLSPPKPTICLHTTTSTLTTESESIKYANGYRNPAFASRQISKQIQELQGLINMQLEFQQSLVQQLTLFQQLAAADQSFRRSKSDNARLRVPPGFEPLIKKEFENLERPIPIAKDINRQEELAQAPKFCQALLIKEAGKDVCLSNKPEKLQQNIYSIKNHQKIS